MKKLLVIVGPTGSGKTALALELAKKFDGELVSADSRQIYLGMDVATGKETPEEKTVIKKEKEKWIVNDIPIHLYDLITPDRNFSVSEYQQKAYEVIREVQKRGKLPILVGGTGLYVQAVVEGLKIPKAPPNQKLREGLESKSTERLLAILEENDPKTFEKIDKNNRRRLTRALEVFYSTGRPMSELREKFKVDFDYLVIGLTGDRNLLYERADKRIDRWFERGEFEKEVEKLLKKYPKTLTALTSLGYQDVISFLEGNLSRDEAIQRTKFKHHGYIRRQLTWFRKMAVNWINISNFSKEELTTKIQYWLKEE